MNYLKEMFQLYGKIATVVEGMGASGRAVAGAGALAKAGARTVAIFQENQLKTGKVCNVLTGEGCEALPWKIDVSDEARNKKNIRGISSEWDNISVLINASGVNSATPIMNISEKSETGSWIFT